MRISAEFDDWQCALAAARELAETRAVEAEDVEIRSAWPLYEEALPPHFDRPMRIRNLVRVLWVFGAIGGLVMVWYCQVDYKINTGGQPLVPLPLDAIVAYECAQLTALVMTAVLFFSETTVFRARPNPPEEDLGVACGMTAVVVSGEGAESAGRFLEGRGARVVRTFRSVVVLLLAAVLAGGSTGCAVRMRTQTGHGISLSLTGHLLAQPIKDQENENADHVTGVLSMPSARDADLVAVPEPYGRILPPDELDQLATRYPGRNTPPPLRGLANPVPDTVREVAMGKRLYQDNCAFCHGARGNGDGTIAPLYAIPPAKLTDPSRLPPNLAPLLGGKRSGLTDADMFWILTVGPPSNTSADAPSMPPFGSKMAAVDRFAIVRYVRELQREAGAKIPPPTGANP